jgi:hypothetical protein
MVAVLRSRSAVTNKTTSIGTRLASGLCIRVAVIGGPGRATTNTGRPVFQLECWGGGSTGQDEGAAAALAGIVEDQMDGGVAGSFAGGNVVGSWVEGDVIHSPDVTSLRERYILTAGLVLQP